MSYQHYGAGEELAQAAKEGNRQRMLELLRDHIADRIGDGIAARDLAALARQLRDITKELEELAANADDDDAGLASEDELARRRDAVLSAAGVDSAGKSGDARSAGS